MQHPVPGRLAGAFREAGSNREKQLLEIGFLTAALAGALSFLSPCVLPLVPPYLCYMAGVSVDQFRQGGEAPVAGRWALLSAALAFVLGFSTVFVLLGAGASTAGSFLRAWQREIAILAGMVIILMGLNFLGVIRIPLLAREARLQAGGKPASLGASYVMGLAFAFGWTPCIGPVLGPILTLAGGRESVGEGALLLAVYSAGLGVPFVLAAMFSGAFMRFLSRFRFYLGRVEQIMGALLVLAGIAFLTGGIQAMGFYLLELFPWLGELG